MSEFSWSQELGDKILAELPEEIAASVSFQLHGGGDAIVVFYPENLRGTPDFQVLDGVVRGFGGAFVSRGKNEPSYYLVPNPKPKLPAVLANEATQKRQAASEVQSDKVAKSQSDKVTETQPAPTMSLAESAQPSPNGAKPDAPAKQAQPAAANEKTPIEVLTDIARLLGEIPLALGDLSMQLLKISETLDKLVNQPKPAQAFSPAAAAPPIQKVERSTHPTEGHREGDVVWIFTENQKGERFEKALAKDNEHSNDYYAIQRSLVDADAAGKKGVVLEGKWYWLSKDGDWIGRKPAKEFPKGGRR